MIQKLNDFLAGLPMTIVGGVFLLLSFILPRTGIPAGELLAWVTVVISGIPLVYLAVWRVIHNRGISKISSALLISVAMTAAILIGDLFAAGEVAFIMAIGAILEDMTTERAKKGLKNLISLTPQEGRRITDGREERIPAERIQKGDLLRVLPGEIIPADGVIVSGETSVDQSIMTGESLPVEKAPGDPVFCGTINRFGSVDIRASSVGEDSSLQKLIRMVEEAEKKQAPAQRIADKWASWLIPAALCIAIIAYLVSGDIVRAVTVLVVFCPCALVLATPTAIMAAIGQATKHGVIIKSGEALEKMGKVNLVAFDKTGTLTYGKLAVCDVVPFEDLTEEELLRVAASAERRSEHPLGKAITEKADAERLDIPESEQFTMSAGRGISSVVLGKQYIFGNEKYLEEHDVRLPLVAEAVLLEFRREGKAALLAAELTPLTRGEEEASENGSVIGTETSRDHGKVIGVIALSDILREEAPDAVEKLRELGTRPVLLTGDRKTAAAHLAARVGIEEVFADLLPEDKVSCLERLKQDGTVCMVGDGVNDAPALKTADVGIAMGTMGSDIAVEAADIALVGDDISKLPYLKWLSNTTVKTIRGAISLSMTINFVAVTLSVLGILTPTTGALVHNTGSCFVVLLAALLYDRKYKG